eukprot:2623868-Pyramimonas_sp.AAC.1
MSCLRLSKPSWRCSWGFLEAPFLAVLRPARASGCDLGVGRGPLCKPPGPFWANLEASGGGFGSSEGPR